MRFPQSYRQYKTCNNGNFYGLIDLQKNYQSIVNFRHMKTHIPALAGIPPTTLPTVLLLYPQLGGSGNEPKRFSVTIGEFVRPCSVEVGDTGILLV